MPYPAPEESHAPLSTLVRKLDFAPLVPLGGGPADGPVVAHIGLVFPDEATALAFRADLTAFARGWLPAMAAYTG